MRIPNSIRDTSIVRIAIQVDGSFNETLELTGAQLNKLASLLSSVAGPVVAAKLVAGDEAAEKREEVPPVQIETARPDPTETKVPEALPELPETPAPAAPALPDVTPELGD